MPAAYMTLGTVAEIVLAMRDIQQEIELQSDCKPGLNFNLVGGEPTLDLDAFYEICRWLPFKLKYEGIYADLSMTTNGWWLADPRTFKKFMRCVRELKLSDIEKVDIRISHSAYHAQWQSELHRRINETILRRQAADLPMDAETMQEFLTDDLERECPGCGWRFKRSEHALYEGCPECGEPEDGLNEAHAVDTEADVPWSMFQMFEEWNNTDRDSRIYVERQSIDGKKISPVGRAKNPYVPAMQDSSCGPATSELKFTFAPDGSIYDFCCNGGKVPNAGHARDGSQLLYRHIDFMQHLWRRYPHKESRGFDANPWQGERCRNCSTVAREWAEGRKANKKLVPV